MRIGCMPALPGFESQTSQPPRGPSAARRSCGSLPRNSRFARVQRRPLRERTIIALVRRGAPDERHVAARALGEGEVEGVVAHHAALGAEAAAGAQAAHVGLVAPAAHVGDPGAAAAADGARDVGGAQARPLDPALGQVRVAEAVPERRARPQAGEERDEARAPRRERGLQALGGRAELHGQVRRPAAVGVEAAERRRAGAGHERDEVSGAVDRLLDRGRVLADRRDRERVAAVERSSTSAAGRSSGATIWTVPGRGSSTWTLPKPSSASGMLRRSEQARLPRGTWQYSSVPASPASASQATCAVPAPSTATPGSCPRPRNPGAADAVAAPHARQPDEQRRRGDLQRSHRAEGYASAWRDGGGSFS